jgi:hypothetical protein
MPLEKAGLKPPLSVVAINLTPDEASKPCKATEWAGVAIAQFARRQALRRLERGSARNLPPR